MNRGRKISGGKYHKQRKRRLHEKHGQERHAILGDVKSKKLRVRSGKLKTILLKSDIANIIVKGKAQKAKILNVIETPQNRFYARQNRLLKSALIQTSLGKAKITNRPTLEGQINAVLVEENK